jgi:hypothetical protein
MIRRLLDIGPSEMNDALQHCGVVCCGKIATMSPKIATICIFDPSCANDRTKMYRVFWLPLQLQEVE